MQDIRYHITNTIAVILFSYTLAATVNQFFKFGMNPTQFGSVDRHKNIAAASRPVNFEEYQKVIVDEANFFEKAAVTTDSSAGPSEEASAPTGQVGDLTLLGTISGPSSIARALIKKRSEKEAEVFKLWKDVYGYKLVRIDSSKVYLKSGETVVAKSASHHLRKADGECGEIRSDAGRAICGVG